MFSLPKTNIQFMRAYRVQERKPVDIVDSHDKDFGVSLGLKEPYTNTWMTSLKFQLNCMKLFYSLGKKRLTDGMKNQVTSKDD